MAGNDYEAVLSALSLSDPRAASQALKDIDAHTEDEGLRGHLRLAIGLLASPMISDAFSNFRATFYESPSLRRLIVYCKLRK
jgi:hypothetical protein